ncbi:peptidoglycan DD-metalloendopeptidase family protein [Erysipelotrichaceae bacterium OttesenSCG-928-M19]|nr:peptidoglycan DD-metalloendopeptidase family protein [Erysipelotrichaceae bacterium OttesenSCG-928-M19]
MKKKSLLLFFALTLIFGQSIGANTNFSKNEAYYQKLCAKRSSFKANKSTCEAFEAYLKKQAKDSDASAKNIKDQIASTKNDISKLIELIKENGLVIEKKKKQIATTENDIKTKEAEIELLEDEIIERLALMQEMSGENFMVDFLMSSTSLDDLLTKIDGVTAINNSNNEVITDLDYVKKELAKKQKALKEEKKKLEEAKKEQSQMLKDYRSKESELFAKLEEEHKKKAIYNTKLDNLNVSDVTGSKGSKGWIRPVSHATVTAIAWYYPASFGGGWHPGIDLANSMGTPIKAPANGVVLAHGQASGYGNYMITAHQMGNDTYTFIYGHMSGFASFGSSIKQGQTIAYIGSTGNSTGPHLHFEVFRHKGKSLKSVINRYRSGGDLYFGLGYNSIGSCSSVCRLKPHEFLGLRSGQVF